jgi:hypothetical protein
VLHAWFNGERHVDDTHMRESAEVINDVSRRADAIERDARRINALSQLEASQTYDAIVTGSARRDARVRLLDSGIAAVLPRSAHLQPGTRCRVTVVGLDPLLQRIDLRAEGGPKGSYAAPKEQRDRTDNNEKNRAKRTSKPSSSKPSSGKPSSSRPSSGKPSSEKPASGHPAHPSAETPTQKDSSGKTSSRQRPARKRAASRQVAPKDSAHNTAGKQENAPEAPRKSSRRNSRPGRQKQS